MKSTIELTTLEQRIIRHATNWVLNGHYSYKERPQLSPTQKESLKALDKLFDSWRDLGVGVLTVIDGKVWYLEGEPPYELSPDDLQLIKLSVRSFVEEITSMREEFEIITRLPSADGFALIAKLDCL